MNHVGHADLRVADMTAALRFYEELLPALGFTERYHGENWKVCELIRESSHEQRAPTPT